VRVLIVKTSSMGDVVHALPLAADIARARPGTEIDWIVEESFGPIPAMSRHVARVRRVALRHWRHHLFEASTRREVGALKEQLRAGGYGLVLDAQGLLKSAWVARWAGAPVAGFSTQTAREQIAALFYSRRYAIPRELHAVERCRRLGAAAFGYSLEGPPHFDLRPTAAPVLAHDGRYAVLLVNASRATKLWPDQHWIDVERWLAAQGMSSLLFWGTEEEGSRVRALAARMQRAIVAPRSQLEAIATTLAEATVVIGLDTGLSHLAAALGRPAVGIYCDYDPALVGLVGDGPVASLGGVGRAPDSATVIEAAARVMERAA
jgi:heptosyltransferase I